MKVRLRLAGTVHEVHLTQTDGGWSAQVDGESFDVRLDAGPTDLVHAGGAVVAVGAHDRDTVVVDGSPLPFAIEALAGVAGVAEPGAGGLGPISAPMTGKLDAVHVKQGDVVDAGDVLFVLEAMKMRNEIKAQGPAKVGAIKANAGDAVDPRTVILELVAVD